MTAGQTLSFTAVAAASGIALVNIRPTNRRQWVISQIAVQLPTGATAAAVTVLKNGSIITPILIDPITLAGAAGGAPPVTINPSDTCAVRASALTAGQRVTVTIVYDDGAP